MDVDSLRGEHRQCSSFQPRLSPPYVLNREVEWGQIIKQKGPKTLPDIPTRDEVHFIINSVRKLRFRIFLFVVYSLGLRTTEGLKLEVGDVDGRQHRVHIRNGKGGKDQIGRAHV